MTKNKDLNSSEFLWPKDGSTKSVLACKAIRFGLEIGGKRTSEYVRKAGRPGLLRIRMDCSSHPFTTEITVGTQRVHGRSEPSRGLHTFTINLEVERRDLLRISIDTQPGAVVYLRLINYPRPTPSVRSRLQQAIEGSTVIESPSPAWTPTAHLLAVNKLAIELAGLYTEGAFCGPPTELWQIHDRLAKAHCWQAAAIVSWCICSSAREADGPSAIETHREYGNLAIALKESGHPDMAHTLERHVFESLTTDQDRDGLIIRLELGNTLLLLGATDEGKRLMEEAFLAAWKGRAVSTEIKELVATRYATLLSKQGDHAAAVPIHKEVLASREQRLEAGNVEIQRSRLAYASAASNANISDDYLKPAQLAHDALRGRLPANLDYYIESAIVLAKAHTRQGSHEAAAAVLQGAIAVLPQDEGVKLKPALAYALHYGGQDNRALELCRSAHQRRQETRGCHLCLSLETALGNLDVAEHIALRILRSALEDSIASASGLSTREANLLCRQLLLDLSIAFSLSESHPLSKETERVAFELACLARSLPLAVALDLAPAATSQGSVLRDVAHEHRTVNLEEVLTATVEERRRRAVHPESRLADLPTLCTAESVARRLPHGGLFLQFVSYFSRVGGAQSAATKKTTVFILDQSADLQRVTLCDMAELDAAIIGFFTHLEASPDRLDPLHDQTLASVDHEVARVRRLLAPIASYLGSASSVWISSDEALAMAPMDTILRRSGLVSVGCRVAAVSSVADSTIPRPTGPESALLVGGLDFGATICPYVSGYSELGKFPPQGPLPDTRREIDRIAAELSRAAGRFTIKRLLGDTCCRHVLVHHLGQASLVHIATHGDFQNPPLDPRPRPTWPEASGRTAAWNVLDPLAYSMLILSGASQGPELPDLNSGLLPATEIPRINMQRARLCVLSACSQSVGLRTPLEGVASMQRAFLLAGTACVISAPIVVPDEATRVFMSTFYQEYASCLDPQLALMEAKRRAAEAHAIPSSYMPWTLQLRGFPPDAH